MFYVWGSGERAAKGKRDRGDMGACWRVLLWQLATGSIADKAEEQLGRCAKCHSPQCSPVPAVPRAWPPGLLPDNLASGAVLPWQQPQGEWSGVFCPSSPLFHPSLGRGQAAPVYTPVWFEALSCRAGPARNKPVS